jgi:YD repeat-containing protein
MRTSPVLILGALGLALGQQAQASETKTYTYDALGRLVTTTTSGTVNNGATVNTTYDPADNRTSYQVTGSVSKVVVVPLNGLTVIPIPDN